MKSVVQMTHCFQLSIKTEPRKSVPAGMIDGLLQVLDTNSLFSFLVLLPTAEGERSCFFFFWSLSVDACSFVCLQNVS